MSMHAEQSVLGCLMVSNLAFENIPNLQPQHFHNDNHRLIYSEIYSILQFGKTVDPIILFQKLQEKDLDQEIGGMKYLNELATGSWSPKNIERYAEIIVEAFRRRQLRAVLSDISGQIDGQCDSMELINQLGNKIDKISENQTAVGFVPMNETLSQHVDLMQSRTDKLRDYVTTGISRLDELLGGGMNGGDLVVLAGRPGMGKTACALTIALENAQKGNSVLFYSMEMQRSQVADRLIANIGNVALGWVKDPSTKGEDAKEWPAYSQATQKLSGMPLLIDDTCGQKLPQIAASARKQNRLKKVGLIIVDYLGLMRGGNANNRNLELGEYTKGLKSLAKELDCPVLLLAQLNRGVEQRADKRPSMSDLRDSGEIEADADTILMLYRDAYYNKSTVDDVVEILIQKQRQGECGVMAGALFVGAYQQFRPLAWEYKPSEPQKTTGGYE